MPGLNRLIEVAARRGLPAMVLGVSGQADSVANMIGPRTRKGISATVPRGTEWACPQVPSPIP